jgi:hypothetical protein
MARRADRETLLEAGDGPVLVALGNWVAEALQVEELSNKQVLLLFMLLDRGIDALWRQFPEVLLPLMMRAVARLEQDEQ